MAGMRLPLKNNTLTNELRKVLEFYGYKMTGPSSGSSHKTFRKSGCMPITIPHHDPIKRFMSKWSVK